MMDDTHPSADEFTPQELVQAFTTVCKQAVRSTGGSRHWQGETREFLNNMELLLAVVEGRPFQPQEPTVLDDLAKLDDILDRVSGKLDIEFSSILPGLDVPDNPKTHVEWMKDCSTDCKAAIRGLRQSLEGERPILDGDAGHRLSGGQLGL
jgi:hypothetical protein